MGSKDFNDNKEIITSDTSSDSATAEDIALLDGEPFSIKSHWIYKAVGWLGICYSVGQIIWALWVGVFDEIFDGFFVGMFTLNIFLLIMARTSVYIDQHSVTIVRAFGRYQINWDEIQKIVFDRRLQKVVFYGQDKWLVMPRIVPNVSGRRYGVAEYVNAQVRARKYRVEFSDKTPNRSKNVMISIL